MKPKEALTTLRDLRGFRSFTAMNEWILREYLAAHFARVIFEQITRHNYNQSEQAKSTPGNHLKGFSDGRAHLIFILHVFWTPRL